MRLLGQRLLPLLGVETYGSGSSTSSSSSSHSRVPSDIRTTHTRGNTGVFSGDLSSSSIDVLPFDLLCWGS